jgi:hypothetical protein
MMKQNVNVKWREITFYSRNNNDFISLTDIAKYKSNKPEQVIQNWMRNRNTIEFLWLWEKINNKNFKHLEFEVFKKEAWLNAFLLSPKKWIEKTESIWIISKSWRYWWTFSNKDIAFEFANWISVEFRLYFIKEFQRLKEWDLKSHSLEWSVKRELTKINYKLQTDSIKNYLIPSLEVFKKKYIYSDEADLLNVIIFGKTAKDWREENGDKIKNENIRDFATIEQLLLLANLENLNWEFIKQWLEIEERYKLLSEIAKNQMRILFPNNSFKNLKKLWKNT